MYACGSGSNSARGSFVCHLLLRDVERRLPEPTLRYQARCREARSPVFGGSRGSHGDSSPDRIPYYRFHAGGPRLVCPSWHCTLPSSPLNRDDVDTAMSVATSAIPVLRFLSQPAEPTLLPFSNMIFYGSILVSHPLIPFFRHVLLLLQLEV